MRVRRRGWTISIEPAYWPTYCDRKLSSGSSARCEGERSQLKNVLAVSETPLTVMALIVEMPNSKYHPLLHQYEPKLLSASLRELPSRPVGKHIFNKVTRQRLKLPLTATVPLF